MELPKNKPARSFRDLKVWQEAYKLSVMVYRACENFPKHEQFGLISQMTRSSVSVCSNIAEGFGRRNAKEKDQFYAMSNGSLTELENQVIIARGIKYLEEKAYLHLINQCTKVHKLLTNLQKVNRQKVIKN